LRRDAERMERAVGAMVRAHCARDEAKDADPHRAIEQVRIGKMRAEAKRIREFLATHAERRSDKGAIRKSNVTDNDSAKMATAKGVIQGYAAVDAKAQIIVAAQAHGSGSEQSVLVQCLRGAIGTGSRIDRAFAVRDCSNTITVFDLPFRCNAFPARCARRRSAP
jgi:hypothetical protein